MFFFFSCNVKKNLRENEFLVEKNKIIDNQKSKIPAENLTAFFRQKPNRKILNLVPFKLWLYNRINQEKMYAIKEKRNLKYDKINESRIEKNNRKNDKRIAKGKSPKNPKLKDKDKATFRESLLEVAEEPVILDSSVVKLTTKQINRYLFSKGFFYSNVKDSIIYNKSRKTARVFYTLNSGKPHVVENIYYKISDTLLAKYIFADTLSCLIKRKATYNTELIEAERERITENALNNGYYFFEHDYIYFDVDTNAHNHKVAITICSKQFPTFFSSDKDSIVYQNHRQYKINNIYIITENLTHSYREENFKDTVFYNDLQFLLNNDLSIRKSVMTNCITIRKNDLFKKNVAEQTYKGLLNLGIFRSVLIQFVKNPFYKSRLDCYIICTPLVKQSLAVQAEGTNTSGNLGIDGSLVYQNKNLFKGAELFEMALSGALSAQKQFNTGQQQSSIDINAVKRTFNTLQFGPYLNFSVPRAFFPFSLFKFKKSASPHTYIKTSINYQERPEFSRSITDINYGFNFKAKGGLFRHDIIPLEIYGVKAKLFGSFEQDLKNLNDFFLLNSFVNHITTISKYTMVYNDQQIKQKTKKYLHYFKISLSSSGNILRQVYQLTNQKQDSLGRYNIFNVPFAHFLKVDLDYRIYIPLYKKNRLVYRIAGGVGKPLTNLNVLPYEQSYFCGGPNSVRAWRARTIGPGSYVQPTDVKTRYDKIGDMLLEGNIEYRFHLFKEIFAAWFTDAGNIWLLHQDTNKPGGEFDITKFYKEIAIGSGFGIRWDLSFFVLRLDAAIPVRDPRYPEGDRFTFDKKPWKETVLNFGIGYPF